MKMTVASPKSVLIHVKPYCTQKGQNCIQFWPFLSAIGLNSRFLNTAKGVWHLICEKDKVNLSIALLSPSRCGVFPVQNVCILNSLTLLHSERAKLFTILAFVNAIGLR